MAPQAQPLLTALPEHFAGSRQSCYLYAASELVKTFGGDPAYEQALGADLSSFTKIRCYCRCSICVKPIVQISRSA